MEARRTAGRPLLASFVLAALAAQAALLVLVESRTGPVETASQGDDVKKPDCVPGVDPHSFPGTGGGGQGGITPVSPSHGGSGGGYVPTPSHGGGGGTLPSPSHGGSGSSSSPTSPSTGGGGAYGGSPSPSTPGGSGGGGAYGGGSSPSPAHGGGGAYGSSPTPAYGDGIGTATPTPFVAMDPHSFGTCDYWRSHPMEIWSAIGGGRFPSTTSPSSMGHWFGGAAATGAVGVMSIEDALSNTRADGTGALLREGAAALLNSITRAGFPYTTDQVRDAFAAAAAAGGSDDGAAAAQAAAFRKANEGKA